MTTSNALAVAPQGGAVTHHAPRFQLTPEKVDLLKRTVANGCSDDELELFLHVCGRTGLDPFARQIYAIKRGGKLTIQTGIDGYRLTAHRTGEVAGISEATFGPDVNGCPEWARVEVLRHMPGGRVASFAHTAYWSEYVQLSNGRPVDMWARMPRNQLAKCAESAALRKGFPAELSGVYTSEEMAQADADGGHVETVQGIVMANDAELEDLHAHATRVKAGRAWFAWHADAAVVGIPRDRLSDLHAQLDAGAAEREMKRAAKAAAKGEELPAEGPITPENLWPRRDAQREVAIEGKEVEDWDGQPA